MSMKRIVLLFGICLIIAINVVPAGADGELTSPLPTPTSPISPLPTPTPFDSPLPTPSATPIDLECPGCGGGGGTYLTPTPTEPASAVRVTRFEVKPVRDMMATALVICLGLAMLALVAFAVVELVQRLMA